MERPKPTRGLRHVALWVGDLSAAEHFYKDLLGMRVEWRPDAENVYLTSGADNLALHQAVAGFDPALTHQRLDHIGFILETPAEVDAWHSFLTGHGVKIQAVPHTHRDGARSFYCLDPAGNRVQMIYHPPLATL